jgi:acyl-CoA hydrolase
MEAKPVSYSRTVITELMIPSFANFSGKVHGGILLSLMDKVAYACAAKHSGSYCVTVSVDGVEFKEAVEVGELVSLIGSVNYVGKSSMIIGITVSTHQPETGQIKHTNSCHFTMVAKYRDGALKTVPGLVLENDEDIRNFYHGQQLKAHRSEIRRLLGDELQDMPREEMIKLIREERCIISGSSL